MYPFSDVPYHATSGPLVPRPLNSGGSFAIWLRRMKGGTATPPALCAHMAVICLAATSSCVNPGVFNGAITLNRLLGLISVSSAPKMRRGSRLKSGKNFSQYSRMTALLHESVRSRSTNWAVVVLRSCLSQKPWSQDSVGAKACFSSLLARTTHLRFISEL